MNLRTGLAIVALAVSAIGATSTAPTTAQKLLAVATITAFAGPQGQRGSAPNSERATFDVVSVKSAQATAGGGRGNAVLSGCAMSHAQYDPGRFSVSGTTLYTLVVWAYGTKGNTVAGCRNYSALNLISGGPSWIQSDLWDIQAVIPEGSIDYTLEQFKNGETPKLQKMIQTFLEDRFRVVVRREMKDVPAYVLTAAKDAPKFTVRREIDTPQFREPWKRGSSSVIVERGAVFVVNSPIEALLPTLEQETGRPVLDSTGLTGRFNFFIEYTPLARINDNSSGFFGPSIFNALQEQVGLKLESARSSVGVLVIDRAEKPLGN